MTTHRKGVMEENEGLHETEALMRETKDHFQLGPKTRMVVLSHGRETMFNSMSFSPGIGFEELNQLEHIWSRGQKELVEKYMHANAEDTKKIMHQTVEETGHLIPQERPESIVSAVQALVNEHEGEQRGGLESIRKGQCPIK